jgi:hypothetical protein
MLHGARTWPPTEKEKRMLYTCQRKMEGRILRVVWSDRMTNAEIRKRTKTKNIVAVTHSLRWKWGGRFHQEAVALTGLIRLIYLLT